MRDTRMIFAQARAYFENVSSEIKKARVELEEAAECLARCQAKINCTSVATNVKQKQA